jgi:hypothetical protein
VFSKRRELRSLRLAPPLLFQAAGAGKEMTEPADKIREEKIMDSPNSCVSIMAILAEMARCLNENIGKVHLAPIDPSLTADGLFDMANRLVEITKA